MQFLETFLYNNVSISKIQNNNLLCFPSRFFWERRHLILHRSMHQIGRTTVKENSNSFLSMSSWKPTYTLVISLLLKLKIP
jgi:hypothetical protein